jgi:ubiquinone/menaquinone biosynthesis C-methylase UbiE
MELLAASGLKTGLVLDVGMGKCGCMTFFLAKEGFNVVGVDCLYDAVHDSEQDAKKENFTGTFKTTVANGEYLPFGGDVFNAVMSYHAAHHMKNVKPVIEEMFRVCKPLGFVIVADLNEKGLKVYGHESDHDTLIHEIEHCLLKYAQLMKRIDTEYNYIFVCQKLGIITY